MDTCTVDEVRSAVIAALRDRVTIAMAYVSPDTPQPHRQRLQALAFAVETSGGRTMAELKDLHARAGRLVEDMAHHPVPVAGMLS